MKIRTQLLLACFLLSVLPLTGIVFYSYRSSRRDYGQTDVSISHGDTVLLMSDGFPELQNAEGQ